MEGCHLCVTVDTNWDWSTLAYYFPQQKSMSGTETLTSGGKLSKRVSKYRSGSEIMKYFHKVQALLLLLLR